MKKREITIALSAILFVFYVSTILYVSIGVMHVDMLVNYFSSIIYQVIGFVFLAYFIFCNIVSRSMKTGYLVPLIIATVLYTVAVNVVNVALVALVASIPHVFFVLINRGLLILYALVSIPMYVMGRK